ncbi:MAG: NIPSNAP family protein [Verrucomicrobiales bacterium]
MRIYYAAEGKLDALQARFRDHTVKLFEKHGMTNLGYWTPIENPKRKLVYVLSFPDRAARDASFKAFGADPEWQAVAKATEANGRLVEKIESHFLQAVDFSPAIAPAVAEKPRVFELRTYTTTPGNRDRLLARFRNHTVALFSKHGMGHFAYWIPQPGQKTSDNTLVYLLNHASREAAEASFKAFRADPDWIAARAASEKEAGGSLTVEDGVTTEFLVTTDYSPTR